MIKAFFLTLLFSVNVFGALPNSMNIEVRVDATAGNLNGGGFNPARGGGGVDYSQQAAAQYNGTNLASVDATTTCTVTSATHNFISDDLGNIIHITAGTNWTAGWYEIISVAANAAVLDRACGSSASVSSGTFYVGGAMSLGAANDDAVFEALGTPGTIFYFRGTSGTILAGGTIAIAAAGTAALPVTIQGYATTRGDAPTGSTRPFFNLQATRLTTAAAWQIKNMSLTSSVTTSTISGGAANRVIDSKIVNTSTTTTATAVSNFVFASGNEIVSLRGVGYTSSGQTYFANNWVHNSDVCFQTTTAGNIAYLKGNVFEGCATKAINLPAVTIGGMYVIEGNTIYGSESKQGIGVSIPTNGSFINFFNNILYGLTSGVVHADTQTHGYDDYNNYFNNTTDVTNWTKGANDLAVNPGFGSVSQITGSAGTTTSGVLTEVGKFSTVTDGVDILLIHSGTGVTVGGYEITSHTDDSITVTPAISANATADKVYTVFKGHDFRVSSTVKARGYPGTFPGGLFNSYTDLGAVQRREGFTIGWGR